jgi:hypothetical protein
MTRGGLGTATTIAPSCHTPSKNACLEARRLSHTYPMHNIDHRHVAPTCASRVRMTYAYRKGLRARNSQALGRPDGGVRFILSLRAIGEGHVSSLTFRVGTVAADGGLTVDPTARHASIPRICHRVAGPDGDRVELIIKPEEDLSERVIFPVAESQSNGIEDARFV